MAWESAEKVQKNDKGEYRALIGGQWIPVAKAQKSASGQYRVDRAVEGTQTEGWSPYTPSGEQRGGIANITPAESVLGHPVTQFAVGAAEPVLGAAQAAGLPVDGKAIKEMSERGAQLYGGSYTQVPARIAGNVLSPAWLGLGKIMPAASGLMGAVGQGSVLGGVAGATTLQDENDLVARAMQAAAGGVAGGVVGGGVHALTKGYQNFLQPILDKNLAAGRIYNEAAGAKAPQVIQELRNPQQMVPGSVPTAGEAAVPAGATKFAALQKQASMVAPDEYLAREQAQNAARLSAVRSVGQDKAALESAEALRSATGQQNYGAVANDVIPIPEGSKISEIFARPSMRKAMDRAWNLVQERGRKLGDGGVTVGDLQAIKMSLDDMVKDPQTFGIGASEVNAIQKTRGEFVNWLASQSKGWEHARATFAKQSAPINQMQVGQELERKLVPAISDEAKQRAGVFAEAMRNAPQTIKRATGQPRFEELTQVLTPTQLATVNAVKNDLSRSALFEQQATKGMQAAPDLTKSVSGKLPGFLERNVFIANSILSRLEASINRKLAAKIAVQMLDDLPGVANSMETAAQKATRQALIEKAILGGGLQSGIRETQ